jgi:hypothetical protein
MDKSIMETVEKTLKDYGIDWIMEERGDKFTNLLSELELALSKVIN